jgi:VWFA-related protein
MVKRTGQALVVFSLMLGGLPIMAPAASGQTESPQLMPRTEGERQRQYEERRRITLAAIVMDASGAPVSGLSESDFTLTENGKTRKPVRFEEIRNPGDAQVQGLIVIDAINIGTPAVRRQVKEIRSFLAHQKALPFPITIVVVSEGGLVEGDPSTDPATLLKDLEARAADLQGHGCDTVAPGSDLQSRMEDGIPASAQGAPGLTRADCRQAHFLRSMNALHRLFAEQENTKGRAIVVWMGPGWPLPQEHESGMVTGSAAPSDAGNMVVDLSADMRHGQVTFDGISPDEFKRSKGLRRKGAAANIAAASRPEQEAMLTIPALAEQSGGQALAKSKNIAEAIERCLEDETSFYTLSFDPVVATAQDEYRVLDLKVNKPGMTVRTMHSYFEEPD